MSVNEKENNKETVSKKALSLNKKLLFILAISITIAVIIQVIIYFHKNMIIGYIVR